ncbi:hypothetical protein QF037_000522 [Streptomyces canus]|nr:hypothetical protein [Streptomyces canus]
MAGPVPEQVLQVERARRPRGWSREGLADRSAQSAGHRGECGHRQWETLTTALANPDDVDAWCQRDMEQSRQRDEQLEQERQQQAQWLAQDRERMAVATPPVPLPVPCERCGRPFTSAPGLSYPYAPPEDGWHCPECRTALARQPMDQFKALFTHPPPGSRPAPPPWTRTRQPSPPNTVRGRRSEQEWIYDPLPLPMWERYFAVYGLFIRSACRAGCRPIDSSGGLYALDRQATERHSGVR